MIDVRLIALGDDAAGDDAASLLAARCLADMPNVEIILAGRPGERLLELLDTELAVVLVDVVRTGSHPGYVHQLRLDDLVERAKAYGTSTPHAFGPAETLRRGAALGQRLPAGLFVGIEGVQFEPGTPLSPPVELGLEELTAALRGAIGALQTQA